MCIIINKLAGSHLPSKNLLKNAWARNPDGAGFTTIIDGALYTRKGFMNFNDFYDSYKQVATVDAPICLHFRIATSGGVSPAMCHPFEINSNAVLFHNGILSGIGTQQKSDTMLLATEFLTYLPIDDQTLDIFGALISNDYYNKFVIATPHGFRMYGDFTEIDKGLYASNTYFLPKNSTYKTYYETNENDFYNDFNFRYDMLPLY